jgi:hypothetical protein
MQPPSYSVDAYAALLDKRAREMLLQHGADALQRLKDQADEAGRTGDTRSARTRLDIAERVMDLLLQDCAG